MRIISGSARGRKLADFNGTDIRPTPDRVREALFSILASRLGSLAGLKVLELFAGSGAQSLEALSRGAEMAILVDSGHQAAKLIRDNIARCGMQARCEFIPRSASAVLPSVGDKGPFGLIFMDPPYHKNHIGPLLEKILALQLLARNGIICAETAAGEQFPLPQGLELLEKRRYGATEIHLIIHHDPA